MKNIIVANWKMHFIIEEAQKVAAKMVKDIRTQKVDVVLCANYVHLDRLGSILSSSVLKLGAQNMHFEEEGAFTGEVSPLMLRSAGCEYVIIGHSERRHIFQEDNVFINKKIRSAKAHGLIPILCVGETLEERDRKKTFDIIEMQLEHGLKDVEQKDVVIAYEPVWAIGTGVPANVETIEKVHNFIRSIVGKLSILYGGSVKVNNADKLASIENVDGFLIGSASLVVDDFKNIIDKFISIKGV